MFKTLYFLAPFAVFESDVFVIVKTVSDEGTKEKALSTVIEDVVWLERLVKLLDSTEISSLH